MATELILRGFNPDPSILRVGEDYYVATSTFEWWPGVQIHHSRNLKTWRLVARPLNRIDLLDLRGVPDSCGVWAPCLSWCEGKFWLVYTIVTRFDGAFKDTHNYVTTCETVDGHWSRRVYLNSSGFDPSLFHADDGRKWLVNMVWDHRPQRTPFGGIEMREYSPAQAQLVGEAKRIFAGTALGCTEGPHLYQHGGWTYLVTAEGGTGYNHAVTVARSRSLQGPFEPDPAGPVIKSHQGSPLQRAGHASLVTTPQGELYMAHLCSRPLPDRPRSPMGRESALTGVSLVDGWLRATDQDDAVAPAPVAEDRIHRFDGAELDEEFQWLRTPHAEDVFSLTERPGRLRLRGRDSLGSLYTQALLARRQTEFAYEAETELEFEPENFQQMAGLAAYYNGHKHHYLYISRDEGLGKHLAIMSCNGDLKLASTFPLGRALVPLSVGPVKLRMTLRFETLQFSWSSEGRPWSDIGPPLDASLLSDEAGKGEGANFTGAFVAVCAQDVSGQAWPADFTYLRYRTGLA